KRTRGIMAQAYRSADNIMPIRKDVSFESERFSGDGFCWKPATGNCRRDAFDDESIAREADGALNRSGPASFGRPHTQSPTESYGEQRSSWLLVPVCRVGYSRLRGGAK